MFINTQRGFAAPAAIIIAIIIILGGGAWYISQGNSSGGDVVMEGESMEDEMDEMMPARADEAGGEEGIEKMVEEMEEHMGSEDDDSMMENGESMMEGGDGVMMHEGEVLAGKDSPYLVFNKTDFDAALKTDKLVVLYFYAKWCPTCKKEQPEAHGAFDALTGDDVIGFRVNYNDNQTDADEKALAREYGVGYQHTKVFVKNGEQILKSPESWNKERYLSEINKALN